MSIIDLLSKLDVEDLLVWRGTIDTFTDWIEAELSHGAETEEYIEQLQEDLDNAISLRAFLLALETSLQDS